MAGEDWAIISKGRVELASGISLQMIICLGELNFQEVQIC